jgi:hypothetical protein
MANAATCAAAPAGYTIRKRESTRWWEVLDPERTVGCASWSTGVA